MLIQLPIETWIEILDWLRRRDLIKKLDQLWDREFTPIVQDWLHKYTRNVKIGRLSATADGLSRLCNKYDWEKVPFAEVNLPENITGFKHISISYMDSSVLAFLRRLRPLFHNIHFLINDYYYVVGDEWQLNTTNRTAVRALMPMLSSNNPIDSLTLDCQLLQFFTVNHQSALSNAKLLQICDYYSASSDAISSSNEWLVNWLFTPREDGQPSVLILSDCENPAGFWEKIRERFLDPTRQSASPFFVLIQSQQNATAIENVRTGEQLTVNGVTANEYNVHSFPSVLISNYRPLNIDPEWLAKKEEEVRKWNVYYQQQGIWLNFLTLGPLEDDDDANAEKRSNLKLELT